SPAYGRRGRYAPFAARSEVVGGADPVADPDAGLLESARPGERAVRAGPGGEDRAAAEVVGEVPVHPADLLLRHQVEVLLGAGEVVGPVAGGGLGAELGHEDRQPVGGPGE